jgi:Predicted transcriptional regulators
MNTQTIRVSDVVFREDLYPRIKKDPTLVQKYAADIEVLPPIEVNQRYELIDGWHRLTAHRTAGVETIQAITTPTESDVAFLALAIERNAKHGAQLNDDDKKMMATRLFSDGYGITDKKEIARILSVSEKTVGRYLEGAEERRKERIKKTIFDMYLTCHTQDEIADEVGLHKDTISERMKECRNLDKCPKSDKLSALFEDDFVPPLYNVWRFSKSSNSVAHFGESEQTIVENLLWLYTKPFDIVVDPFAGGGSTLDVCRKRLRRCWISDRKPIPAREHEIRLHDIKDGVPPLNKRWSEVSLTYLDPPYWRQAAGQYSNDAEDLANQPLEEFTKNVVSFVVDVAKRQSKGAIALIIQPTQWKSDNKEFVDHVFDIIQGVKAANAPLVLENRVSCPYNSEQYMPQMVNYAKENKKLLVLTRELIIWRCAQ